MCSGLEDDVAIVTGAGAGIGRETARVLSDRGATVVGLDIAAEPHDDGDRFDEVVDGGELVVGDVTDGEDVDRLFERAREYGPVSILVNNAGIAGNGRIDEVTEAEWDRSMDVHVKGAYHCCRRALPEMERRNEGSVINISSIAALGEKTGAADYVAAKGSLASLTRGLASDFSPAGVRVNAIAPGFIKTEMNADVWRDDAEFQAYATVQRTLLPHVGEPADIAHCAAFLCSDEARFITGQVIPVDGGWTV